MMVPTTFEFFVGLTIGNIVFGALFASTLFRNIAFAGAATGLCLLYLRDGLTGIMAFANALQLDFLARPDLSKGMIIGSAVAALAVGLFRRRSAI